MANKALFQSARGPMVPAVDAVNAAGGPAYALGPKAALARYAMTGCLSNTFYVTAEDHLDRVVALAAACEPAFLAKLAIVARKDGFMKDMPALLLATLAARADGRAALKAAFPRVIDNGRMVRSFVQILRSGRLGRKSLGTGPRNLVRGFLSDHAPSWLFRQLAVGKDPSGADVIKMVHPRGPTPGHEALYGYLIGKVEAGSERWSALPPVVRELEAWKASRSQDPPAVPFELLTAKPLTGAAWAKVFRQGGWHFVRMNLNTAIRHGALEADLGLEGHIAERLRDREAIGKARVMPYQILAAYVHVSPDVPRSIVEALHDAAELAVDNVPVVPGRTLVVVDVSGSMSSSITGFQPRKPQSLVRCIDVAALFAAAILRKNREAVVLPVDTRVHDGYRPEPRNTVLSEAQRLAGFGGGGTALGLALHYANARKLKVDHAIILSDQESWADRAYVGGGPAETGTVTMHEWEVMRQASPGAKLVCIDLQPGKTHQAIDGRDDILHVSGWSDAVFKVVSAYLSSDARAWLDLIEKVDLAPC